MHKKLRTLALTGAITIASFGTYALDLPVKSVNGNRYYYYEVEFGDTVYSLSDSLSISRDDIIRYNPGAADGVKAGTILYFPYEVFAAAGSKTISHEVKRGETLFGLAHRYGVTPDDIVATNPETADGLKSGQIVLIPVSTDAIDGATQPAHSPNETPLYVASEKESHPQAPAQEPMAVGADTALVATQSPAEVDSVEFVREASIAVMLPFALGEENVSKQSQLYTDFYKGMLIAADELRAAGQPVSINVFDSSDFVVTDGVRTASVIIAPEDDAQLGALAAAVSDTDGYVINIFNLKDESYLTNPSIVQANIPHSAMYAKAYAGMRDRFGDMRPVILRNNNGRAEKSAFTDFIREKYIADGIAPVEIGYNGTLRSSDLDILDAAERYVIVPSSGTLAEFNKMSHGLKAFRDDPSTAAIEIFGYPDWTAFRNDALDMLHALGATIYTRVFINPEGDDARAIASGFMDNFGAAPMEVVPNQGALGYDVASMIISNLRAHGGVFDPEGDGLWRGRQSAFRFEKAGDEGGFVNNALYIVTFANDKTTQSTVL